MRIDEILLRPARADEAPAMAEMSRELIEAGLQWRYTPQRMHSLIKDPETVALVAHDGPLLRGLAVMQFGDEHAHLALLCVQAAQQRRGIGQRLMEWLLASAQVAGMGSIRLELRADNEVGLAFYQRLGFTQTQVVEAYYDGRIAARRMRLWVGKPTPPTP